MKNVVRTMTLSNIPFMSENENNVKLDSNTNAEVFAQHNTYRFQHIRYIYENFLIYF